MPQPHDPTYNRDDEMKPGRPPRSAYEPEGSEGSSRSPKTFTDPATGAQDTGEPAPNQAEADQTEGVDSPAKRRTP